MLARSTIHNHPGIAGPGRRRGLRLEVEGGRGGIDDPQWLSIGTSLGGHFIKIANAEKRDYLAGLHELEHGAGYLVAILDLSTS
jgi:hypothetical protein